MRSPSGQDAGMVKWMVDDVPAPLLCMLLLGMAGALAVGAQWTLRRRLPALTTGTHNEVAGFLVAVIGVVYAVVVGFAVVGLWEDRAEAVRTVGQEVSLVGGLPQGAEVFDAAVAAQVREGATAYAEAVVDSWPQLGDGRPSVATKRALDELFGTVSTLQPRTFVQQRYVDDALKELHLLDQNRRLRVFEAGEGRLPGLMWLATLLASALALGFCLLFGLESARLHYVMISGVAMFIGLNVFLLVQLSYPFSGDLSITPEAFHHAIRDLRAGL
jgi:hypothetical protein